jgi:hypothetical protein
MPRTTTSTSSASTASIPPPNRGQYQMTSCLSWDLVVSTWFSLLLRIRPNLRARSSLRGWNACDQTGWRSCSSIVLKRRSTVTRPAVIWSLVGRWGAG